MKDSYPALESRRKCSMDMRSCRTTLGNTGFFICDVKVSCESTGAILSYCARQRALQARVKKCCLCKDSSFNILKNLNATGKCQMVVITVSTAASC